MPVTQVGRVLGAAVLAVASIAVAAVPASAHADVTSSSPANGAQLAAAPSSIVVTFAEKVRLAGKRSHIIDGDGHAVPARVATRGRTVTFTPRAALPAGRYATAWHLTSVDGDEVAGAVSFTVDTPNPTGTPVSIRTTPKVPTTLSAALPGSRTLFFSTAAKTGSVEWTSRTVPEPITWRVTGTGTKATAKGVLPTSGTWSFSAELESDSGVLVVTGSIHVGR